MTKDKFEVEGNNKEYDLKTDNKHIKEEQKSHSKPTRNSKKTLLSIVVALLLIIAGLITYIVYVNEKNKSNKSSVGTTFNKKAADDFSLETIYSHIKESNLQLNENIRDVKADIASKLENELKILTKRINNIYEKDLPKAQEDINSIKKRLKAKDFTKILIIKISSILEEAKINYNYWGNSNRALVLLAKAQKSVELLDLDKSNVIKNKIEGLILNIKENKKYPFNIILEKINLLEQEVMRFDYDKLRANKDIQGKSSSSSKSRNLDETSHDPSLWQKHLSKTYDEIKQFIKIKKKSAEKEEVLDVVSILDKEKVNLILKEAKMAVLVNDNNVYRNKMSKLKVVFDNAKLESDSKILELYNELDAINLKNNMQMFTDLQNELDMLI